MDSTLALLDTYGVGLLFLIILLKEIGVPVPVPGDLLMVVAGARAAAGKLPLWGVLLAAILAGVIGAYVQYMLARGPGRSFIYRYGKYAGLNESRLDKASGAIKGRGWVSVALARSLPGLRMGAIVACGLAPVPVSTFVPGLVAGTVLFVGFHTMLGFLAGPGVGSFLDNLNVPIWPVLLILPLIGIAGWLWIRSRRRGARGEGTSQALFDWADACCPVCLAAGGLVEAKQARPSNAQHAH
jgi:membrane-associated protein